MSSNDNLSTLHQQWSKSHKSTVIQLLEALWDVTAAEQHMLRFDYFSLHQRCLVILQVHILWNVHNEKFHEYGHGRLEHDSELALIVSEIFKVTLGSVKAAEEYKLKSVGKSQMMRRMSEIVDELIGQ